MTTAKPVGFIAGRALLHLLLLLGGLVVCIPLIWMVSASFKTPAQIFTVPIQWIPDALRFENYAQAWNTAPFARYFLNSLYIGLTTTALNLFFCSLAGYGFARYHFPFKNLLFLFVLATMMIPFHVVLIPLFVLMRDFGWLNSHTALIIPGMMSAFGIFFMRQFIETLPEDLLEAARMDGASEFRIYWNVVLPLAKSPLAALGMFTFLESWNNLLWPLVVIQSEHLRPIALGLTKFQETHSTNYVLIAAASCILIIPMLVIFLAAQRYFVQGITLSGLKG
ncbi:MAG: carbohydrate ABC transporter permease [Anaerolineae bacterium]